MADDAKTTVLDSGATDKEVTANVAAPTYKFADAEGKFVENWKDNLPEDLRGEKCLDVLPDITTMAKNYVSTQKMRGKPSVAVPTEKSSQAELDAFYEAAGRPKTVDDYGFTKPEDLPDELWDTDLASELTEKGWQAGLSGKQMAAIKDIYVGYQKRAAETVARAQETERQEAEKSLKKAWGNAYDERVNLTKALVAKTTSDSNRQVILDAIGNSPVLIGWLGEWALKTSEAKGIDTSQMRKTPVQAQTKIDQLRRTEGFMDGHLKQKDPEKFNEIQAEITRLYAELHPE